jgi:hypothetical protein
MGPRKRSFPVTFEISRSSSFNPPVVTMFYAHELAARNADREAALAAERPLAIAAGETTNSPAENQVAAPAANVAAPVFSAPPPPVPPAPPAPSTPAVSTSPVAPADPRVPPDFSRHARKCGICTHPDRDAIEADFIRWRSPETLAANYQIADRSSIYRHAHSTGLFTTRKRELGRVLEGILEYAGHGGVESLDVVIRAARVLAHLDDDGKWYEPPRTHIILTGSVPAAPVVPVGPVGHVQETLPPALPPGPSSTPACAGSPSLIATVPGLENEPTP